jgi:hypothetical protein
MNWAKPPSSQHTASSSMMQERERSRASDSTMPALLRSPRHCSPAGLPTLSIASIWEIPFARCAPLTEHRDSDILLCGMPIEEHI